MLRTIISAVRGPRATTIELDCGHERSIGGHVWFSGRPVDKPEHLVRYRVGYDCQDGNCYRTGQIA